jgi:hypothetical protein
MLNHFWPAKIIFVDSVLERIEQLKTELKKIKATTLKINHPWKEEIEITLAYGTNKWEKDSNDILHPVRTSEGPVLCYNPKEMYDLNIRTIDTVVYIVIKENRSWIEDLGEEGSIHTLGYDTTIEEIPEVFFNNNFLQHWEMIQKGMYHDYKYMMDNIIEDMPPEHKNLFDSLYKEYSNKSILRQELG